MLFICCSYAVSMLFICCLYVVSMLFLCCFDFVEIYYEKLVSQQFTRKPTNFFNYIDFIQKLNLVDLQTQGGTCTTKVVREVRSGDAGHGMDTAPRGQMLFCAPTC